MNVQKSDRCNLGKEEWQTDGKMRIQRASGHDPEMKMKMKTNKNLSTLSSCPRNKAFIRGTAITG
jgi:hypothetical protein